MEDYKLARPNFRNGNLNLQWYIEFFYKNPETGKMERIRKYISSRIFTKAGRIKKASELVKKYNFKLQSGWNPYADSNPQYTSVENAVNIIIEIKSSKSERARSIETYKSIGKLFCEFLVKKKLHKLQIQYFDYFHAMAFMDYCLLVKKYSPVTYNNKLEQIRSIFNLLLKRNFIDVNHFTKIEKIKVGESPIITYTVEELNKIKDFMPAENFKLYIAAKLIFHQYIRVSELTRLQIRDFNLDRKEIRIEPSKGKNKKTKVLPIYGDLYDLLMGLNLEYANPEHYIFSTGLEIGQKMISPARIHEFWADFCEKHKIENRGIYKLKHTGNGMSLDNGADIYDIFLMNRHSDLDMTRRYIEKHRKVIPEERLTKFAAFGS